MSLMLPPGYREYRFALECMHCLPAYVIRLRLSPGGEAIGEAYMRWFRPDSAVVGDTSERARILNTRPANCATPIQQSAYGPDDDTWCRARVREDVNWAALVLSLDSLGILDLPTSAGYRPEAPPGFRLDTVHTGVGVMEKIRSDCKDLTRLLEMSVLVEAEYRSGYLWCFETKTPPAPERVRAAKAYQLLMDAVVQYSDPGGNSPKDSRAAQSIARNEQINLAVMTQVMWDLHTAPLNPPVAEPYRLKWVIRVRGVRGATAVQMERNLLGASGGFVARARDTIVEKLVIGRPIIYGDSALVYVDRGRMWCAGDVLTARGNKYEYRVRRTANEWRVFRRIRGASYGPPRPPPRRERRTQTSCVPANFR